MVFGRCLNEVPFVTPIVNNAPMHICTSCSDCCQCSEHCRLSCLLTEAKTVHLEVPHRPLCGSRTRPHVSVSCYSTLKGAPLHCVVSVSCDLWKHCESWLAGRFKVRLLEVVVAPPHNDISGISIEGCIGHYTHFKLFAMCLESRRVTPGVSAPRQSSLWVEQAFVGWMTC